MDKKLSIADLVYEVAEVHGLDKQRTELFVRSFIDIISENIITDKIVKIKGLGTFKLIDVQDRESVNINTGERIRIAGHGKITFTPDTTLKDAVNRPFSEFETVILNDGVDMAMMENTNGVQETIAEEEPQDVNGVEEVHDVAETPLIPEQPHVSETPEVPETPATPEVPETPEPDVEPVAPELQPVPTPAPTPNPQTVESESLKSTSSQNVGNQHVEELNVGTQHVEHQTIQQIANNDDKNRGGIHFSVGGVIVSLIVVLLLMAGSFYLGTRCPQCIQKTTPAATKKETPPPVTQKQEKIVPVHQTDKSIKAEVAESSAKSDGNPTVKPAEKPAVKPAEYSPEQLAKDYPQVPGGEYWIVGVVCTHEMTVGENLYHISRKELGKKELIQYIIVMNNFKRPDVIPLGYKIKIPRLVKKQK